MTITLTPIRGKYKVFANCNGELPQSDQEIWNTDKNELQIKEKNPNFKHGGVMVVGVQLIQNNSEQPGHFTLLYNY